MSERERWSFAKGALPWLLWIAAFVALEFRAIGDRDRSTPPLTHVVLRWLPAWAFVGFLIWFGVHFLSRYLDMPVW